MQLERWPLVGRDDELALANAAVATHRGVVLTGAAGVGKTRLAHEVLDSSAGANDRTEWIAATAGAAQVPLGAVAHLVPSAAISRGRDATLRAIVATLERERGRGRLLLGVDDAHLLDDASASLVHLLSTTGTASVVITTRSDEVVPDPVVALWKDGPVPLVVLQALARHEAEDLVQSVLGGRVEGAVLQFLWDASAGNALYLRELVRHGIESGALRFERALWRWVGHFEPGGRLQDVVGRRMGALDDLERAGLEVVAVGEPLPVECLGGLGLSRTVQQLERRGLVTTRSTGASEIRLAHPLFGEAVRAGMPATRLDEIRLLLAEALAPFDLDDPAMQFRIALWRAEAGDHRRPDLLCAAARRAWSLWAPAVAERLARAALESGPDLEAGYLLGEALSDQGRTADALAAWREAAGLPGPDHIRAAIAIAQASSLNYHLDQPAAAEAVLREARARTGDTRSRQVLDGALAVFGATSPRASGVPPVAAPANAPPQAMLAKTIVCAAAGQLDLAVSTADACLVTAHEWADEFPVAGLMLRVARTWARMLSGHVLEAEVQAEHGYMAALRERADQPRVSWCLVRGLVAVMRGQPVLARGQLLEGVAVMGPVDRGWLRPMHAYLAMAAALVGDHDAAITHEQLADSALGTLDRVFAVDVQRARGWVRAARGELTAATVEVRVAVEHAAGSDQGALEALALHDLVRFGHAGQAVHRLEALAGTVDGVLVDTFAAHARARAHDDGGGLDAVSASFADLGLELFAAEASAAAAGSHRRAGRRASAFAAHDRAIALAGQCEGARTPGLVDADDPVELTAREREIAELAARALSSKEIAARLSIATRTVDNLLGRVYVKLGIAGRAELVGLFRDHPSTAGTPWS